VECREEVSGYGSVFGGSLGMGLFISPVVELVHLVAVVRVSERGG
jgi:hypothetical protein